MSAFPDALVEEARRLLAQAQRDGATIATVESCTGGLVAALLTEIAGSSAVVECGFVTYSNAAKTSMVGVPDDLLRDHGAVSAPVARAMAEGALARSRATLAVSITGVAGPGGGSAQKPVGLVHFACAMRGRPTLAAERRFGDIGRAEVRMESVAVALDLLRQVLGDQAAGGAPGP